MKYTNALGGCANCGTLTSPCWRKGPDYAKHLCNACGSRYLVKGTLEGYKPGQKNRSGGRRSKPKNRKSPMRQGSRASPSPARYRVFKEPGQFSDKGVQVDPFELEQMAPFVRLVTPQQIREKGSPESQADFIQTDQIPGHALCAIDRKDSSGDSMPEFDACMVEASNMRKRARKPAKPTNSGW